MITIIAGGRDFTDAELMSKSLKSLDISEVVSGRANGADLLGECWAKENGIRITVFPADWIYFGKSAGFIRNKEMANYAEQLVAFWDGASKGTQHMIKEAERNNLVVHVVRY